MAGTKIDYSLYLVTDSTPAILGTKDLATVVEAAVVGGVTIVQYRDKESDTGDLIDVAKSIHKVAKRYNVPLIINDRLDVALAIGAEGVHLGQDDMNVAAARKILGPKAIIGATASSAKEALTACRDGADYLGIGTVYSTATKPDSKSVIGPSGVREILAAIKDSSYSSIPCVCIGSINSSNAARVLTQTASHGKHLNGLAVVSAIIAAKDPEEAATDLLTIVHDHAKKLLNPMDAKAINSTQDIAKPVLRILKAVANTKPLNHNMTNQVVQNFAANIAIAGGSSPIMSNNGAEASDLAGLGGALVINMGTVTPDGLENYIAAVRAYNGAGNPVLFDPVGGGATSVRRAAVKRLMHEGYFTVIKGNDSEIRTVLGGQEVIQRGVDGGSAGGELELREKMEIVRTLAAREHNVVLMTGAVDCLSDGVRVATVRNGHKYLGEITGSGCALGTTIAACLAVERTDVFAAALAGLLIYEIATEHAAKREDVRGPGTFVPAFIDELYRLRTNLNDEAWLKEIQASLEHAK